MQSVVSFLSAALSLICATKLFFPRQMAHLMALDWQVAVIGLATALICFALSMSALWEFNSGLPLRVVGMFVLGAGMYAFFSPTLGGERSTYLPILDVMVLVESGIIFVLLGTDKRPAPLELPPALSVAYLKALRNSQLVPAAAD